MFSICKIGSFGALLVSNSKGPIKCFLNNEPRHARSTLVNINFDETCFYSFTVSVNKFGGSCNAIDNAYAQFCVQNKAKNMSVEVFNLMSRVK